MNRHIAAALRPYAPPQSEAHQSDEAQALRAIFDKLADEYDAGFDAGPARGYEQADMRGIPEPGL